MGTSFERFLAPPDAFIDTRGIWHDDNDAWDQFMHQVMSGKSGTMPNNLEEAAQQSFMRDFESFLDNELQEDDCIIVLDCHSFP